MKDNISCPINIVLGSTSDVIGVFKETNKVCLQSLLEGKNGSALHSQIRLEIDSNLADKTLEGCLPDQ
jgi:hypothetical protein